MEVRLAKVLGLDLRILAVDGEHQGHLKPGVGGIEPPVLGLGEGRAPGTGTGRGPCS